MPGRVVQRPSPPNPFAATEAEASRAPGQCEMHAAIAIGDITLDLRAGLPADQGDAFGAAGDRTVSGDRRVHPGFFVPSELERIVDDLDAHQTGVRTGAPFGLEPRAGAAILAVDCLPRLGWWCGRRWRRGSGASRQDG